MPDELRQAIEGVWPPLLVAVPCIVVARRPWSRDRRAPGGAAGASLGVGLGFGAAYWVLKGAPLPPHDANTWHVVAVAVAGVLGLGGLVLLGHHLAWAPPPALPRLLLVAAPFAAWVERARPVRGRADGVRAAVVGLCTALPLGAAVWLAQAEFADGD